MAFGLHYSDTLAGRVFSQTTTPVGLALPLYTTTAIGASGIGAMHIWNPPNSNRNVELISFDMDWVSGTAAITSIGLMVGPLSAVGTATGCSAMPAVSPMNGLLMGGGNSKCVSNNGAGTMTVTAGVTTAPVLGTVGAGWALTLASINLEASTATPVPTTITKYTFDGTVIIPPGVLCYFAGALATVALYAMTVKWKEIPINPQGG